MGCWGLSSQPLDLCSQSGANDLLATAPLAYTSKGQKNLNQSIKLLWLKNASFYGFVAYFAMKLSLTNSIHIHNFLNPFVLTSFSLS